MKFLFILLSVFFIGNLTAQDYPEISDHDYDLTVLINGIAKSYKVPIKNIKVLKVIEFEGDDWLFSKLVKDGFTHTIGVDIAMSIGGGPVIGPKGSIACKGVKCSQCKFKGPLLDRYCDCTRDATIEEGYCEMIKSVGISF